MSITRKIWDFDLNVGEWVPNQGTGSTDITSLYKSFRMKKKLSQVPMTATDSYFHIGYPYCFFIFTLAGSQFTTFNTAGPTSLRAESHFTDVNGIIQFRQEDGMPTDCTAVVDSLHIVQSGSNWIFKMRLQKPTAGIGQDHIDPLAN